MEKFTDQLYEAAKDLWQKSHDHPFITELQSGKLPMAKFKFYLLQDQYYLRNFSRLHGIIAHDVIDPEIKSFLKETEKDIKNGELVMHQQFFSQLKITPEEINETPISPTAYNYVNHLAMEFNLYGPAAGITALLPCYWLYQEIGQELLDQGSPVSCYQQWIETYDSAWYVTSVKRMKKVVNRLAEYSTEEQRNEMNLAFRRSSYYELQFWQMAYTEEKWQ